MRPSTLLPVLVVLVALGSMTGCAPSGESGSPPPAFGASAPIADSDDPWAGEFADAYRRATTDFERAALADGRITDGEFAEMSNAFAECLTERGVTFGGFKPGGSFEFVPGPSMSSDDANDITDECSARTGLDTIGYLYFAQQRNPQNEDDATLVSECLVRKRAVAPGYSARDYQRDSPTGTHPFLDKKSGETALIACEADPLGRFEQGAGIEQGAG